MRMPMYGIWRLSKNLFGKFAHVTADLTDLTDRLTDGQRDAVDKRTYGRARQLDDERERKHFLA